MAKMSYTESEFRIEDGPAAGTYAFSLDAALLDGRILDLGEWPISGRIMRLKVDLEKNLPELLAEMNQRKEATRAKLTTKYEAEAGQRRLDEQMRSAGF